MWKTDVGEVICTYVGKGRDGLQQSHIRAGQGTDREWTPSVGGRNVTDGGIVQPQVAEKTRSGKARGEAPGREGEQNENHIPQSSITTVEYPCLHAHQWPKPTR